MVDFNNLFNIATTTLPIFVAMAGVAERVTEYVKELGLNTTHKNIEMTPITKELLSLCAGCAVCLVTGTQLYSSLPIPVIANELLAGVVVSLGSNFLHQALNIVLAFKDKLEVGQVIHMLEGCSDPIKHFPSQGTINLDESVVKTDEVKIDEVKTSDVHTVPPIDSPSPKAPCQQSTYQNVDPEVLAKAINIALSNINK